MNGRKFSIDNSSIQHSVVHVSEFNWEKLYKGEFGFRNVPLSAAVFYSFNREYLNFQFCIALLQVMEKWILHGNRKRKSGFHKMRNQFPAPKSEVVTLYLV